MISLLTYWIIVFLIGCLIFALASFLKFKNFSEIIWFYPYNFWKAGSLTNFCLNIFLFTGFGIIAKWFFEQMWGL